MKNNIWQILLVAAFLALLVILSDQFMLWMPEMGLMAALLAFAALACVWMGFVAYERAGDERDAAHRMYAGRFAYLAGVGVLTLALVLQGLAHSIDPWISLALGIMIVTKLAARLYLDRYR